MLGENGLDDDDNEPRRSRHDNDADNVSVCITAGIFYFSFGYSWRHLSDMI
jgi:hypothetical protein